MEGAAVRMNLGGLVGARGDLESAKSFLVGAVMALEEVAPDSRLYASDFGAGEVYVIYEDCGVRQETTSAI